MESKTSKVIRNSKAGRLTSARAEKFSAVEGLTVTPRMRALLTQTKDKPGSERRELIRAQLTKKSAW